MLQFKNFRSKLKNITEKLTKEEESDVNYNWEGRSKEATKATDHYFGKGVEDKYTPLTDSEDKSEIHKAIERHLGKQISKDEYKSGQTTDHHGRPAKIGRLLNKSKAPSNLTHG